MIKQVRFSNCVKFFERGFCSYWGITPYHDSNKPCLFMGVYNMEDVDIINKHKGFKVVANTGGIRNCFTEINPTNIIVKTNKISGSIPPKYKTKEAMFPIKDFSIFTPNLLGDKVYCYLGTREMENEYSCGVINKLKKILPFEILCGFLGNSIEYVKKQYYDKCFINIKPNLMGGITTAVELSYMGRKTISNTDAPFCISYNNFDEVVNLIMAESKKIGTVQKSCIGDYYNTGEEWMNEEFWI